MLLACPANGENTASPYLAARLGDTENQMRNRFCAILVLIAALACAAPARSGVVVDTFGPGNSHDPGTAWAIGNFLAPHPFDSIKAVAAPFTLLTAGTVDDVAVAAAPNAEYSLIIASDIGGLPGTMLGTVSGGFSSDGYIDFDPSILLEAGTYWLVMKSEDRGGWFLNNSGAAGAFAGSDTDGATWFISSSTVLPAYRVGVTAVSEPGTLAIFSAALLALSVRRRKAAFSSGRSRPHAGRA
jgi:hypothetical protein